MITTNHSGMERWLPLNTIRNSETLDGVSAETFRYKTKNKRSREQKKVNRGVKVMKMRDYRIKKRD